MENELAKGFRRWLGSGDNARSVDDDDVAQGVYRLMSLTVGLYREEMDAGTTPSEGLAVEDLFAMALPGCYLGCKADTFYRHIDLCSLSEQHKKKLRKTYEEVFSEVGDKRLGFFTNSYRTLGEVSAGDGQAFIGLLCELYPIEDRKASRDKAQSVLEARLGSSNPAHLGDGTLGGMLHALKPCIFPIVNGNEGMGIGYGQIPGLVDSIKGSKGYLEKARAINDYVGTHEWWPENHRLFDDYYRKEGHALMDDIGDLMEEDYGKFKKLLKVFVDQAEANRVMKDQGESLTFTKSRKVGPPWKPNDSFRQRLGLDYGFDELSDGLVIGMTFFTNGHYNTSGSTYMNIGKSDTEGGSWVNVVPDFDPSKRMTRLTVRCHPKAAEKLQGPLPESLTRELSEEINGLGLDSDAKPNGAVRGMLDLLVSLHQELERDEMANTSADGLVCKVERDVLASRNVILHGAPGTGKTYLAREVAARIIGCTLDDLDGSGQFGFVQFHPSYDYTDFVEGLRPYDEGQGGVGFKLEKGSFMYFVGRAREAQEPKETSSAGASFDDVWDNLVEDVAVAESEGKDYTIDTVRGKPLYLRTAGREGDVLCRGGQAPYFNKEQCRNVYRGEKGVPAGGNDSYRRAIVNRLESDYGLPDHSQEPVPSGEEASKERDDRGSSSSSTR